MKMFPLLMLAFLMLGYVQTSAQTEETWGCPVGDHKCQLAGRMKALEADPKNPENYYNVGLVLQRSGAHDHAIETYSMYIVIPGVPKEKLADGYNNRGISYRAIKKFDLAVADYTKAIELMPTAANFYINRGNAYSDLKDSGRALADYARAIELDPRSSGAYAQRGNLRHMLKQDEAAIADLTKAIELDPNYAEPYYTRGVIYSSQRQYAKAIPDYDRYIPLIAGNPEFQADGYMNRGIAHYYTNNPQKAVDDFTKVIELQPDRRNGYLARAMVYTELKKTDLAAADTKKAATLDE